MRAAARSLLLALIVAPLLLGCSVRKLAVRTLAKAMASGTDVYATDDDPELVAASLPFALKTLEGLLAQDPGNRNLLLATSKGFTQYAYAFVQLPAERLTDDDYSRSEQLQQRAVKLFLRARDYALRGLATTHPGIDERLRRDPAAAAAELTRDDLPLAYWTAAAWGSAISAGKDRPELLADLGAVRALLERGLALDEGWEHGALHQAMLSVEASTPAAAGGSPARVEQHYQRAAALAGGHDAGLFVSYAQAMAVPARDRAAFESLLEQALAVGLDAAPELRLANTLAQQKARWLLDHADDYFSSDEEESEPESSPAPTSEPTPTPNGEIP
ncbi:MAG TPA: TRAP transporter TatT component family protein [Thermoanaerobaculia bacterium]|jgi:predicted anti-sigma-YlaC factor YlaD|nr:TRAP transporter TatT component family protein [Thermoanaerobaculia bacterium]